MKKLKDSKPLNPFARKIVLQAKVNSGEMHEILKNAHTYCDGNVSQFVRIAAQKFVPKKGDFEK